MEFKNCKIHGKGNHGDEDCLTLKNTKTRNNQKCVMRKAEEKVYTMQDDKYKINKI